MIARLCDVVTLDELSTENHTIYIYSMSVEDNQVGEETSHYYSSCEPRLRDLPGYV